MDIGSILMIMALALLVGVYIARPFFTPVAEQPAVQPITPQEHERSHLLAERERLVLALRELDFDHVMGKIPESDYPTQRQALVEAGVAVLRKLNELEPQTDAAAGQNGQRMDGSSVQATGRRGEMDELEEMILQHRRNRQEKAAGFCPQCGKPVQKTDQFCSGCGTALNRGGGAA